MFGIEILGLDGAVIGLFMFSVGTSLPELAISFMAAIKKENEIALGNIVGSNIFNVLCVGGLVSASTGTLTLSPMMTSGHLVVMLVITFLFVLFLKTGKAIGRIEGFILLAVYLAFTYVALNIW